ncbi:MAG: Maltose/maltodextrin ABC transporter, permease protein MalG [uncultured Thermomicrobiales bacterium]|uniref:Maltose/maltodextrin ABC transporter, permease protein MalG n=1 Tax=uncultured Thermomicrobiales bacterium TaxID=1645740 RepID=A0A6J4UP36_9BACT|nr:MAG: Maltose/maltodextrin ABC transporter, permease protein MalG [uncultured Thermomicrobiales bacterium]
MMATSTLTEADAPGSGRGKRFFSRTVLYAVALLFSLFAALPFAWMLLTIFKTNNDLYKPINNPFIYNDPPTLSNLDLLWNDTNYRTFILNTFMIAIVVVLITVVVVVPAAYSLVRLAGRWGEGLGVMIFLVYLVPPTLLFIPLTGVVADLGLQNSKWSMALIYPTFTIPFCTWLLMGFLRSVPWEIEEQAMIDGYTRLGAIWRTVIPISLPGILTVVIFSFTLTLHEFVYSLAFVQSSSQKTVSVGVFTELIRGDVYFWQSLMAAAALVAIPVALLYNAFLDRFIAGFTLGAVKG